MSDTNQKKPTAKKTSKKAKAPKRRKKPGGGYKVAAGVEFYARQVIIEDVWRTDGFAVLRVHQGLGVKLNSADGGGDVPNQESEVWQFAGHIRRGRKVIRTYVITVFIKLVGKVYRPERLVTAIVRNPDGDAIHYSILVPGLGEKRVPGILDSKPLVEPSEDELDDVLSGLSELMEHDHLGSEELADE